MGCPLSKSKVKARRSSQKTWIMKFEDPALALDPDCDMEATKIKCFKTMTNDVVLSKSAEFLPLQDLLTARATCQLWNSIFVIQLRKKHKLVKLRLSNCASYEPENVRKFNEVMKTSLKIPFSQFRLSYFKSSRECRESFQDFASICGEAISQLYMHGVWKWEEKWETSSVHQAIFEQMPNLTDLELYFIKPWPQAVFRFDEDKEPEVASVSAISTVVVTGAGRGGNQMLPKLKRFTFGTTNQQTAEAISIASQLVSKMIHCATGLEALKLDPYNGNEYDYIFLHSILTKLGDSNKLKQLRQLQIETINISTLELLLKLADSKKRGENALRLEKFEIPISGKGWKDGVVGDDGRERREMTRMLWKFLATQASTLIELSLWWRGLDEDVEYLDDEHRVVDLIPIHLPRLDRLRTLSTPDSRSKKFGLHFDGDTFASTLPVLKKLSHFCINYYPVGLENLDRDSEVNTAHIFHPGVTDLSIKTNLPHLAVLPTQFLSVTRLNLHLNVTQMANTQEDQDALASIWSMWPTLTHLDLNLECNADKDIVRPEEFLTGVVRAELSALRSELLTSTSTLPLTLNTFRVLVRKYKTRLGVSDLSRLKELTLVWYGTNEPSGYWNRRTTCRLTDIGFCCGLALCGPQLQHIDMTGTLYNLVSESCIKFMKSSNVLGPGAEINVKPWSSMEQLHQMYQ